MTAVHAPECADPDNCICDVIARAETRIRADERKRASERLAVLTGDTVLLAAVRSAT